ncbi:AT-rich interaction domain 6 [Anarrhichthys ocellatus]|uniref:AT-rich interaction domain 6 n=1 Tax=Anarrhichthys ocellatus TaxID=433405 RepID=UPI0012EE6A32|nr:uncharacterized protein LOC116390516 [Anarrhichthys ocellatus]
MIHVYPLMETQTHREMAQAEILQERTRKPVEEMTEEQFLKDLYTFMKKRDTPVERIPNLGFKQIDLYVMFKIVKDFGGYHQVTSQQLWKQVYNTLGGNPRSTSAATCTRRHYEKLLLPYECHLTGILVNVLPRNQPKHFHFANYSKEQDDGQRPLKRKLVSMPLHQNQHNLRSDLQETVFPVTPYYARHFHPTHAVLPPHVPIPSYSPPAPKPWLSFPPSHLNPTDRAKEPLEQLRYLAEQYKTTSGLTEPGLTEPGLTEPWNLSINASRREANSIPASSFTPTSSSKSPKFLNKPSPLYTPHHPQVVRHDGCETQDGEAGLGDKSYLHLVKASEAYAVDVKAITPAASSSPSYDSAPTLRTDVGATTMPQKPSSPKRETHSIWAKEEREGSPEVRELNFSHLLPSFSQQNGGKMEIEVPLSVFRNWLRQCGSSAAMLGAKQLPTLPPREDTDFLPTNLTFHMNPQHQSSAEDLRLTRRNLPSPIPTTHTTGKPHNASQNTFTTYKPLPSGGILKSAASQDVYPFEINKSLISKPLYFWDTYAKETQASPIPVNIDSIPCTAQEDIAASTSYEDTVPGGKGGSDMGPSAGLMLNSSSTSLSQLTTEEVMKLRKMISSSL